MSLPPVRDRSASERTSSGDVVRVVSLNAWGYFGDWPTRRAVLATVWSRLDPDVVLVQEACAAEDDQVSQLSCDTGLAYELRELSHQHTDGVREGLAILSRWPFGATRSSPLSALPPIRRMIEAEIIVGSKLLTVRNLHATFSPESVRLEQVRMSLAVREGPLVIGGDFNTRPEQLSALLPEGVHDPLATASVCTWPVDWEQLSEAWEQRLGVPPHYAYDPARIDYLLVADATAIAAGAVAVERDGVYGSDHAVSWLDVRV